MLQSSAKRHQGCDFKLTKALVSFCHPNHRQFTHTVFAKAGSLVTKISPTNQSHHSSSAVPASSSSSSPKLPFPQGSQQPAAAALYPLSWLPLHVSPWPGRKRSLSMGESLRSCHEYAPFFVVLCPLP